MAIIRSRATEALTSLVPNPNVAQALGEWERRVAVAREEGRAAGLAEAQARVAAAEQRASAAEAAAVRGQEQRQAAFLGRYDAPLKAIAGAAGRLAGLERQLIGESEAELVRLALAVAAAVLRRTVAVDPGWLEAVVRHALQQVPDRRRVLLRMHPEDAGHAQERLRGLTAEVVGLEHFEIVGDAVLSRGACVLQSQGTRIDASLAGCWERLAGELLALAPAADCAEVVQPGDAPAAAAPAAPTPPLPGAKP